LCFLANPRSRECGAQKGFFGSQKVGTKERWGKCPSDWDGREENLGRRGKGPFVQSWPGGKISRDLDQKTKKRPAEQTKKKLSGREKSTKWRPRPGRIIKKL